MKIIRSLPRLRLPDLISILGHSCVSPVGGRLILEIPLRGLPLADGGTNDSRYYPPSVISGTLVRLVGEVRDGGCGAHGSWGFLGSALAKYFCWVRIRILLRASWYPMECAQRNRQPRKKNKYNLDLFVCYFWIVNNDEQDRTCRKCPEKQVGVVEKIGAGNASRASHPSGTPPLTRGGG